MDDKNYTLIHTSPVICKLDIKQSFDWVCNFMNGILSQALFTIAYYINVKICILLKNNNFYNC